MSKKTKVAGTPGLDPTLPNVSIEIGGETYHLCFDYAALATAERKLSDEGIRVNMLASFDLNAERLPYVFYAGLLKAHPDITFAQASAFISLRSYIDIFLRVKEAFDASMAEPKPAEEETPANPTTA